MRHHIPLHQFRHRDGSLIDISSFDPVELGLNLSTSFAKVFAVSKSPKCLLLEF